MDQETKREIIMENYMHPTNRKEVMKNLIKKQTQLILLA